MKELRKPAAEDACLACRGSGDAGPLYSDTLGLPYRLACRSCRGTGRRDARCGLVETAWGVTGVLVFVAMLFAAWVMTP